MASVLEVCFNTGSTGPGLGVNNDYAGLGDTQVRNSNENYGAVTRRSAGTFSGLWVHVTANTSSTTTTAVFRKNKADGNQTFAVASGATGVFQDLINTDTVAAGDTANIALQMPTGTGQLTVPMSAITFTATSDTAKRFINMDSGSLTTATTDWRPISGGQATAGLSSQTEFLIRTTGTFKNLYAYVSANTWTAATSIVSNLNSSTGAMSISVASGATGAFEDLVNSDAVVSGNLYHYAITTLAGSGSITTQVVASELVTTNGEFHISLGASGPSTQNVNTTAYYPVGGTLTLAGNTTDSAVQSIANVAGLLRRSWVDIGSNSVTATSTWNVRRNGVSGSQTISIASSATGKMENTVSSDTVQAADLIDYQLIAGATGTSIRAYVAGMLVTTAIGIPPGTLTPAFVFFDTGQYSLGA